MDNQKPARGEILARGLRETGGEAVCVLEKAHMIRDRLMGSEPETGDPSAEPEPEPDGLLNEYETAANRLRRVLSRADGVLASILEDL